MNSDGVQLGSYVVPPRGSPEFRERYIEYKERELAWEMYNVIKSAGQACVVATEQEEHELTGGRQFTIRVGAAPIINLEFDFPKKLGLKDRIRVLFTGEVPSWLTEK